MSKKADLYEGQEQREADRPEIKDGFSFMNKGSYDSLPLTRWLDKSDKSVEDHPELPKELPEKTILKRTQGMPMEIMLKSKNVTETLKAKGYDLNQIEAGRAVIDEDLRRLLEKLADDKPVVKEKVKEEPEVTILRRNEADGREDSLKEKKSDGKEVVQSLVERIPEDLLKRTMVRKKKVAFKEEAEHLGLSQEFGEWPTAEEDAEEEILSGECEERDEDSEKSSDDQDSLSMILAEEKMRHREGSYRRILLQERTIWISRRCEEVKKLRKLQFQGNFQGAIGQLKCQNKSGARRLQEALEEDSLRQAER